MREGSFIGREDVSGIRLIDGTVGGDEVRGFRYGLINDVDAVVNQGFWSDFEASDIDRGGDGGVTNVSDTDGKVDDAIDDV